MIGSVSAYVDKDNKLICFCSDTDFECSIRSGERCALTLDGSTWLEGIVSDIGDDCFVLRKTDGSEVAVNCKNVFDIRCR